MNHKFSKNRKYYTISIYAVGVIVISALCIRIIYNWGETIEGVKKVLKLLSPFLAGFFIAYMLNPLVKVFDNFFKKVCRLKKTGLRKSLSILLSYVIVLSIIITIMVYVIPQIIDSFAAITDFINTAQHGYKSMLSFIENIGENYHQIDVTPVREFVEELPDKLVKMITGTIPLLASTIYNTSISVITGVVNMLIAIMVSVYMLFDKNRLINNGKRFIYSIMKNEKAEAVIKTGSECNEIFSSFIVGKLIDSTIIGVLCFIILNIVGIPCALIISVIVGITNMIPYFGPFIGAIPSILLLLFIDFAYALVFAIIIIVLQQFDGLYLGPRILGNKTGLRPLWVIFAITTGGYVAGVLGMFLGVPTVAVIAHLVNKFMNRRINAKSVIFYRDNETGIIYSLKEGEELPENVTIIEGGEEKEKGEKKVTLLGRIKKVADRRRNKAEKNGEAKEQTVESNDRAEDRSEQLPENIDENEELQENQEK